MPEETDQIIDAESQRLRQLAGPGGGFGVLSSVDPSTGQTRTTSAYHAAPVQNFDDPAYRQKLFEWEQETRRTAEAARAEQAIQAGIRFIYQRRYDDDLKRGVPEQQAFSKMMLGIAMHGPKTDPIKAFEAFRARPAPQAQMVKFGTNEAPVIIETDRFGVQRAKPVPQTAFPAPPLGETGAPMRDPETGETLGTRFPTGPRSGQIIKKAQDDAFRMAEFRKLLDREEEVEKDIATYESFKDLDDEEKQLLERRKTDLKAIQQKKTELRTRSKSPATTAPETPTPSTKKLYFNPETGQLQEKPYAPR